MKAALRSLLTEVRACTICRAALPHGVRPIVQADNAARVLIAGQAPGRRVHESGVPFDDPSGQRLRDWMGVTREEFYDPKQIAIFYFAYGSNVATERFKARVGPWRSRRRARLSDYRLRVARMVHPKV